jgi:hypothetical protein
MKKGDTACPLTPEDESIWRRVLVRRDARARALADKRDADLMRAITFMSVKHYTPDLPAASWMPIAHLYIRLDPEWPAGHHVLDVT